MHRQDAVPAHLPTLQVRSTFGPFRVFEQQPAQQFRRSHNPLALGAVFRQFPLRLPRQLQLSVRQRRLERGLLTIIAFNRLKVHCPRAPQIWRSFGKPESWPRRSRGGCGRPLPEAFLVGSRAPYGYSKLIAPHGAMKRPALKPDPDTSPVVKRIFEMAEAGRGMLNITKTLNDEGIASSAGKLWGKTSVHAILGNEAYTGSLVWGTSAKDKAEPVRVKLAPSPAHRKWNTEDSVAHLHERPAQAPGSAQPWWSKSHRLRGGEVRRPRLVCPSRSRRRSRAHRPYWE